MSRKDRKKRTPIDLTGQRFVKLFVHGVVRVDGKKLWRCECDCGNWINAWGHNLTGGRTQACGCLHKERSSAASIRHGKSKTKVYRAWLTMQRRCYEEKFISYPNYGGRGIRVCARWRECFENFYEDMGDPPTRLHSLDKKDNDKDYSKDNCRWATRREQNDNKRLCRFYDFRGKKMLVRDIATECGIAREALRSRIKAGWSMDKATTVPVASRQVQQLAERLIG